MTIYNKKAELLQRWPCDAPYIWVLWKFLSLTMRTATFPEIFNGLLFRWILWMCLQNLKNFVALQVSQIIGGTQKIGQSLDMPTLPFSKFLMDFCSDVDPVNLNVPAKFEVHSFTHSRDNSNWSFGLGLQTPNLREQEAIEGWGW